MNIIDLIGREINLKRSGSTYSCLCPFHNDKNPSMHIWEDSQTFKCFACGKGGDAITFTIEYFKLSFIEALKELANRYSIPIPEGSFAEEQKSNANEIYRLNALALGIYKRRFQNQPNDGHRYMKERGFTNEILDGFNIGFSATNDTQFKEFLSQENQTLLAAADLIKIKENGLVVSTFSNRVIFPIEDERGRVLGFGGRTLNPAEKAFKYLNTADTDVFHKRKVLFGLKQACDEIKIKKFVIISEGYTDVMMMHQYGYKNSVAVLGTALSSDHIHLIKRFCKEAVLLLDGDEAGRNAMMRSIETFLAEDFFVSIVILPNGQDPFDALRSGDSAAFQSSLDQRMSITDFLLSEFKIKHQLNTVPGKVEASAELVKLFSVINNPIKLSALITEFSEKLEIDELALRSHFASLQEKKGSVNRTRAIIREEGQKQEENFQLESYGSSIERLMLTLALKDYHILNDLASLDVIEYVENEAIKNIFELLLHVEESPDTLAEIQNKLSDDELQLANFLKYSVLEIRSIDIAKEFERLKVQHKQTRKLKIQRDLKTANETNNKNWEKELLQELVRLK